MMQKLHSAAKGIVESLREEKIDESEVRKAVEAMASEFGHRSLLVLLEMLMFGFHPDAHFEYAFVAALDGALEGMYASETKGWVSQVMPLLVSYHHVVAVREMDEVDSREKSEAFLKQALEVSEREGGTKYREMIHNRPRRVRLWEPLDASAEAGA